MRKYIIIATIVGLSAALPAPVHASSDIHSGRWEITSTMEMPGMAFSMPSTEHTQCITDQDLVPQTQQGNDKCQMLENTVAGDTVTWKVKCESEGGTMTSGGKIVYHGDTFEGTINTTGSQMPSGMTQKITGKRIGNCP